MECNDMTVFSILHLGESSLAVKLWLFYLIHIHALNKMFLKSWDSGRIK